MAFFRQNRKLPIGKRAEQIAEKYLTKRGLKIHQRNYRCRFGEVDLIMSDKDGTIVFVEVRSRHAGAQVSACESISRQKIAKIRKTAATYLTKFEEMPNCRFDVIAMTHNLNYSDYTVNWISNAF
ncbi:MAG: YraN family protein [Gammaproteobacteria bacterium]|nr:MAG: YraN family protein [Gammaproteobacteria bacterium]